MSLGFPLISWGNSFHSSFTHIHIRSIMNNIQVLYRSECS